MLGNFLEGLAREGARKLIGFRTPRMQAEACARAEAAARVEATPEDASPAAGLSPVKP